MIAAQCCPIIRTPGWTINNDGRWQRVVCGGSIVATRLSNRLASNMLEQWVRSRRMISSHKPTQLIPHQGAIPTLTGYPNDWTYINLVTNPVWVVKSLHREPYLDPTICTKANQTQLNCLNNLMSSILPASSLDDAGNACVKPKLEPEGDDDRCDSILGGFWENPPLRWEFLFGVRGLALAGGLCQMRVRSISSGSCSTLGGTPPSSPSDHFPILSLPAAGLELITLGVWRESLENIKKFTYIALSLIPSPIFLDMLVALHLTPVSNLLIKWAEFQTYLVVSLIKLRLKVGSLMYVAALAVALATTSL